ncbi:GFA family protein [Aliirhizobium terrae]|uniref:GFA family protein n=1 Tax=Terrirhizobium terrae TaxID=2926709 RepID=UPI002575D0E5|nr:GFA family protein [Rhizobium sp. CC-CFT758]WJH40466.1 GFA family protein [Rhizobium sp. CC-CFT758]
MSRPFTGGCACGAIRYHVTSDPVAMVDCQCRQCQRESGTGHTSNMVFAGATVKLEGQPGHWEATGDGGTVKSRAFCTTCGSPVYMTFPAMPDLFVIRAASLDEPDRYQPQIVTWTDGAQPWDRIDTALTTFARMPPAG